jgi:HlyD family secretion protein
VKKSDLAERVLSLRLPEGAKSGSRLNLLAWTLVLLFACVSGFLGWRLWSLSGVLAAQQVSRTALTGKTKTTPVAADRSGSDLNSGQGGDAVAGTESGSAEEVVLEAKGNLVARRQVLVSPQVSGRLIELNLEEGRRVTEGEVLAKVDPTEYQANLDSAQASLDLAQQRLLELERGNRPEEISQAEAFLSEAEAMLPQRRSEYERQERLNRTRATSLAELELAESNYRSQVRRVEQLRFAVKLMRAGPREERIRAARAEVALATAAVTKAQWQLDNCLIRAPISGTILRKNAEQGNLVNPIAFNGSFSICDIADLADLEVDLNIQERDISRVFVGQACSIRTDAFPQRNYTGQVSRLMPIADRAKGAIPVRVRVDVPAQEEGQYLKPEMSALVTFRGTAPQL